MSQDEKKYVPSKYQPRSSNFVEVIQQRLGVLDFDYNFDNEFQEFKIIMKFVAEIEEAIKQKIIPLEKYNKPELYPDKKVTERLDKIWNGRCYYALSWEDERRVKLIQKAFCYSNTEKKVNGFDVDKYIPIPRLRNMVPVGKQDDKDNWGVQIRELYPIIYAWEGAGYGTIVNDGKFAFNTASGLLPKIEPDDMYSETKMTYILHKPVYHSLMTDLTFFFRKNSTSFQLNMQLILKWLQSIEQIEAFTQIATEDLNVPSSD